jgi:hypothetical protein
VGETIARMSDSAQIDARGSKLLRQQRDRDLTSFSAAVAQRAGMALSSGRWFQALHSNILIVLTVCVAGSNGNLR